MRVRKIFNHWHSQTQTHAYTHTIPIHIRMETHGIPSKQQLHAMTRW